MIGNRSTPNEPGLESVVERLHDRWFDLADVQFDPATATVTIPFSADRLNLVIRHARDLRIDDRERVGKYDFNTLVYDRAGSPLVVHTGVPVGLEISVDRVDVQLEPR